MSFGIGPHDYGCVCWRCQSRRGVSLLNESQGPEVIKGHCKTAHKTTEAHPEGPRCRDWVAVVKSEPSAELCSHCGQPMLPDGIKKLPNEYDHAAGCPLAKERWRNKTMTGWM